MYLVLGEVLFRNLALPLKPINQLSSRRTGNWYTRRPFWASFQGLPQGMGLLLLAKLIVVMLLDIFPNPKKEMNLSYDLTKISLLKQAFFYPDHSNSF